MIKLKDYLYNACEYPIDNYTCIFCDDIANNAVKCLECSSIYCLECAELLKFQYRDCLKHKERLNSLLSDESLNYTINNKLLFRCFNKGCCEVLSQNKLELHYLICDNLFINCPYKGCEFKGLESEIQSHKINCEYSKVTCFLCFRVLSQQTKLEHNCLSALVEEVILLEKNLIDKQIRYLKMINDFTLEAKELIKNNKSLFRYCKTCLKGLSWMNYLKKRMDCNEGNCVNRSRYYCEDCNFFYCVICQCPPRNLICGCKKEMEKVCEGDDDKSCDVCGEEVLNAFYRCEDCDFDICSNCY